MPINQALFEEIFGKQGENTPVENPQQGIKKLCTLDDVVTILQKKFSFFKYDFKNLKAWFAIPDLIQDAQERDLILTETQAKEFLSRLVKGRFLATREGMNGTEYHRIDIFLRGWESRIA